MTIHGTRSEYTNHKCRCGACRAANTAYTLSRRRQRVADDWAMHGRLSTYINYMCRCDDCKRAMREYGRVRRAS